MATHTVAELAPLRSVSHQDTACQHTHHVFHSGIHSGRWLTSGITPTPTHASTSVRPLHLQRVSVYVCKCCRHLKYSLFVNTCNLRTSGLILVECSKLFWHFSNNFLSEFQFLCPPALNTSHVQTVRFIYKYKWGDMKHRGKAPLINSTSASACAAWTWLSVTARSCECVSAAVHHLPVSLMAEQGAAILPRHLYLTTPPLAHTLASSPDLTTVSAPLQHHCSDNYKPGVGSFGCIRVQKFSPRTHSCWREILHNSCAGSDKRFSWKGFVFSETRARCFTTTKWELRNILNICQSFLLKKLFQFQCPADGQGRQVRPHSSCDWHLHYEQLQCFRSNRAPDNHRKSSHCLFLALTHSIKITAFTTATCDRRTKRNKWPFPTAASTQVGPWNDWQALTGRILDNPSINHLLFFCKTSIFQTYQRNSKNAWDF